MKILLVGNFAPGHVGASLLSAAKQLQLQALTCDTREASAAPRWVVSLNWHLLNHKPPRLEQFSRRVLELCKQYVPDVMLTTGSAPITARALHEIGKLGVRRVNYSTDDPWNPAHHSRRMLAALRHFDVVFSPRRSNLEQLRSLGCPIVHYLPFAYDPMLHFTRESSEPEQRLMGCEVLFVGGADRDRVPVIRELIRAGFTVALHGGYWSRYRSTRDASRGLASPEIIREATHAAQVSLCLVRRSNRDGHVMRSFEMAALGACMLVEDTEEHRDIFGKDGETVLYFRAVPEMIEKLRWLLAHPTARAALGKAVTARVATDGNTYAARLSQMLEYMEGGARLASA